MWKWKSSFNDNDNDQIIMEYLNTFASNLIMSDPSILLDFFVKASANIADTQCSDGVGCCVTDSFYVCQSSQHRQSSCAVYRTAALPVLAGLADIEGISHTAPNASGALCLERYLKSPQARCCSSGRTNHI